MKYLLDNGCFFITICTNTRQPIFAKDSGNPNILSQEGVIAQTCWQGIPKHFSCIALDAFVIMPDHVHGILCYEDNRPFQIEKFGKPVKRSVSTVVRSYKAAVTKAINELPSYTEYKVWQNGFYKHRIQSNKELEAVRKYIQNNPYAWLNSATDIFLEES